MRRARRGAALVLFTLAAGRCWAVAGRRWALLGAAVAPAAAWAQPTEEDVAMMQNALSSVRRIGDFPSKVGS
eukprot:Skav216010  [mRNA]  locus=scaffold833:273764:273979:+ [translate_table: standard]